MNSVAIFAAKNRDAVYPDPEEGPGKKRVDEKRKKEEGSGRDNIDGKRPTRRPCRRRWIRFRSNDIRFAN